MHTQFSICGFEEVYDICGIILFQLNPVESYEKMYSIPGYREKDMEELENYLCQFPAANPKFKLLFDIERQGSSFMSEYYKDLKKEKAIFSLEDFIQSILDDSDFTKKVVTFYIKTGLDFEVDLQKKILFDCEELELQYKFMLLQFICFFEEYMNELFQNMREIQKELKRAYSARTRLLKKVTESFDFEELKNAKSIISDWAENKSNIDVTFSLSNQYVVLMGSWPNSQGWMILGINYRTLIERQWNIEYSVVEMCNALSDDTRFRILREIWSKGEITPTTLVKVFGLPYSVVCYHLDILKKCKLVTSKLQRRTTVYQINADAIENLTKEIAMLGGKDVE